MTAKDHAIISLYNSGQTLMSVGLAFGVSQSTVLRVLVKHGVPRRKSTPQARVRKPYRNQTGGVPWPRRRKNRPRKRN